MFARGGFFLTAQRRIGGHWDNPKRKSPILRFQSNAAKQFNGGNFNSPPVCTYFVSRAGFANVRVLFPRCAGFFLPAIQYAEYRSVRQCVLTLLRNLRGIVPTRRKPCAFKCRAAHNRPNAATKSCSTQANAAIKCSAATQANRQSNAVG